MTQENEFVAREADNWFARNQSNLAKKESQNDPVMNALRQLHISPQNALEVGCSNGYRLDFISKEFGAIVTGIEPSQLAINDGRSKFPQVKFIQGSAQDLSAIPDNSVDLVITHFVLHWIDRHLLFKVAAEIHRVLVDGGLLVIGDFDPAFPTKVHYHHVTDVELFTYKQSYRNFFTASNLYTEVFNSTFFHSQIIDFRNYDEKCMVSVLCKDSSNTYMPKRLQ